MNIEIVREYCLSKAGATEDCAFGPDGVLFRICDKIFAYIDLNRPDRVVVKCDPDKSITLRDTYHGIHTAWHWNKKHWIEIHFETDVQDEIVLQLIDESYELVASKLPKKKLVTFPEIPLGWHYHHLFTTDTIMNFLQDTSCESTAANDISDTKDFVLVTADHQTAGRGQRDHHWEDEDGANLLVGIKMRNLNIPVSWHFKLTQIFSIAITDALRTYLGTRVKIKWPNDIYVDKKKIAGMIFENKIEGNCIAESIVGFGINVNQTLFNSDAPNPTSLQIELGHEIDRAVLLRKIIMHLPKMIEMVKDGKYNQLAFDYERRLYALDTHHLYKDTEGYFKAQIHAIAEDGMLSLMDETGRIRHYYFNEVQLIR